MHLQMQLILKLTSERCELEIKMSLILAFQLDAKLLLLTNRMCLEAIYVLVPFLDFLHKFGPKKTHMMLALMLDPKFKDFFNSE
jgi:hypothetical protein